MSSYKKDIEELQTLKFPNENIKKFMWVWEDRKDWIKEEVK